MDDLKSKLQDMPMFVSGAASIDLNDSDDGINLDEWLPIQNVKQSYVHGSEDWANFDFFGPIFIALFLFVFTFITSGMSLVNEKSTGTMARFLATPVKSWQILGGYAIGFGAFAAIQVAVIVTVALKIIGFPNEGNIAYIILTAVSLAIASVTLGLLVSGLATNAFQVVQLMLIFVVPQIFASLEANPFFTISSSFSSKIKLLETSPVSRSYHFAGNPYALVYKRNCCLLMALAIT